MDVLSAANRRALASINAIINGLHLPRHQKDLLERIIPQIDPNSHLFRLQNERWGPVVEVTTTITLDARPHPNVVRILLDVDIPPTTSSQQPHIGCEVYLNGTRCGNDHIWIDRNILHAGRPQFGHQLEEYGWYNESLESSLPQGVQLQVSFKRYKGAA